MAPRVGQRPGQTPRAPTDREFEEAFSIPAETDYRVDYDNYRGTHTAQPTPDEILRSGYGPDADDD